MGKLKKTFQTTRNFFKPPDWKPWDKQEASSQSLSDYIYLSELLSVMGSKSPKIEYFDTDKLDHLTSRTKIHCQKIAKYRTYFKLFRTALLTSVLVSVLTILLNQDGDVYFAKILLIGGLSILVLSGVPTSILSLKLNSEVQKNLQVPITDLALPYYHKDISRTRKALHKLRRFSPTPYFCEADENIRSVTNSYWKADCWEIALFLDMDRRSCVSLHGPSPSGEFMFLKSEIEALVKTSKPTPNIYEKYGLPRKTRWCPHIRAVQASMGLIRSLVKKGEALIQSNLLDVAFIPQIEAYRVLTGNGQNWLSMRNDTLNKEIKLELEEKIRMALLPEDSGSQKAHELLIRFLKPDNRPFDEQISNWDIIPEKALQKQIDLFHEVKKK